MFDLGIFCDPNQLLVQTMVLLLQFDKIIIKMVLEAEMLCACSKFSIWEAEIGRTESSRPNLGT